MPGLFNSATPMVDPWAAMAAGGQGMKQLPQPPALQGLSTDMMAQIMGMQQIPGMSQVPGVMNPTAPGGMNFGGPDPQFNAGLMNLGVNPNTGQSIPGLSAVTSGAPQVDPQRMQELAGQLAQQMPPPPPGSLEAAMKDPKIMQMMQGLQFKDRNREMELARMKAAAGAHSAFLPAGMGSGSGMKVETPGLAMQAVQQRRGRVPGLGEMLAGGRR